jgi:hypothetical protein
MSITTSNLSNKDRLERIWHLLQDAEKLQQERINSGFDYVNLYVEDVESDWLENWGEDVTELPVRLRQWFHNVFEPDWHSIEEIFDPAATNIAFKTAGVKRAKLFELASQVALIVTLKNESSTRTSILLQLHNTDRHYLPENLLMTVLSPLGVVLGCANAHPTSEVIQLEFTVERGEEFTVELTSGGLTVTQDFLM